MTKDKDHIQVVNNGNQPPDKLPLLLKQVKDNSLSILTAYLENLFGSCDDLFFDLSSRAASNSEQNLYFESMREVRLKKNGVIAGFKTQMESSFYQLTERSKPEPNPYDEDSANNPGKLSLVQNDALEQDVAVSSMVSKARNNCQESLYHLNLRFDYLVPNTPVNERNNPMDPQQICLSFAKACEILELNIKARIIIFKQFDRFVSSKLATVYSSANGLLIDAGVLPKTHDRAAKARSSAATDNYRPADRNDADNNVELEFAELSNLLASVRTQNSSSIPNYVRYSSNPGPALANAELVQLLTAIQHSLAPPPPADTSLADSLRNIISSLLADTRTRQDRALHQPEEDVINLVAMFFDFVLDDRNLPMPVQALISRLQIPVLKVALKDKTFFNNSSHPARSLINRIAEASIGWDDSTQPEKDRLFEKVSKVVQHINDHYEEDDAVFDNQLKDLLAFIENAEHKSSLIERRTGQAAEGQAKTRNAKAAAQKIMFEKLEPLTLPEPISELLTGPWLNLLVMTHLKEGEESAAWIETVQLIDDLAWASQQHADAKSQQRFEKIKPNLLERIAEGLKKVSNTKEEADNTIREIGVLLDSLQQQEGKALFRPLSAAQAQTLGHTPGGGSKSWKDMTGIERQQARYKQLTYEFIRKAEQLPLHTWIAYTDNASGKLIRCKLASRIEASDSYIFVNRFGFKSLEKPRKDFAADLQAGHAVILEGGQLFDRAMGSVLDSIKLGPGKTADNS